LQKCFVLIKAKFQIKAQITHLLLLLSKTFLLFSSNPWLLLICYSFSKLNDLLVLWQIGNAFAFLPTNLFYFILLFLGKGKVFFSFE